MFTDRLAEGKGGPGYSVRIYLLSIFTLSTGNRSAAAEPGAVDDGQHYRCPPEHGPDPPTHEVEWARRRRAPGQSNRTSPLSV